MVLKLVILDLDQTLIYSLKRFYKLFNRSLVEYGVKPVSWEKFI
ncbi:MAG TPA: HAD family hydrolase, partial [Desulfurococcales archaeon]|nr:HAD family hydrolase [Desulfurococcales archaeon]